MTCNICGVNDATIHLTEIVNNQMIEIHLCDSCAQEKGTDFKTHFNFGDILAGLGDVDNVGAVGETEQELKCSECAQTYEEFTKSGRLGCSACYSAFSKMLGPLIKRVQRAVNHVGKKPARISREVRTTHDLRMLQDRLRQCIQNEEFEEAAKIRDKIRQLDEKLKLKRKAKEE